MSKKSVGSSFVDHAGNLCTPRSNGTLRVQSLNDLPSRTIQSEKDSCDINLILRKFKTTGVMSNVNTNSPLEVSFDEVVDFHSAMTQVASAQQAFATLPSALRKRFSNDPGELLAFLGDSSNRDEAIKLGLVNAPQAVKEPQGAVTPPGANGGQEVSEQVST